VQNDKNEITIPFITKTKLVDKCWILSADFWASNISTTGCHSSIKRGNRDGKVDEDGKVDDDDYCAVRTTTHATTTTTGACHGMNLTSRHSFATNEGNPCASTLVCTGTWLEELVKLLLLMVADEQ
jgi:hypothetical protein